MSQPTDDDRRQFLRFVGAATTVALAGCAGSEQSPTAGDGQSPTAGGDQVPEEYRTATSIGGQERDPGALSTKEAVQYQEEPNDGDQCSGCTFYITDMNGDGMGACAIVEGLIAPDAWCASYSPHETESG